MLCIQVQLLAEDNQWLEQLAREIITSNTLYCFKIAFNCLNSRYPLVCAAHTFVFVLKGYDPSMALQDQYDTYKSRNKVLLTAVRMVSDKFRFTQNHTYHITYHYIPYSDATCRTVLPRSSLENTVTADGSWRFLSARAKQISLLLRVYHRKVPLDRFH